MRATSQGARYLLVLIALLLGGSVGAFATGRDLALGERLAAQEAIERVYYSYQQGVRIPFEQAVPHHRLEKTVRTYLRESAALEHYWKHPITQQALDAEWARIVKNTRFPERLLEIRAALHYDDRLIKECFVRPVLSRRLTRNFFAYDQRIHSSTQKDVAQLLAALQSNQLDTHAAYPNRHVIRVVRATDHHLFEHRSTDATVSTFPLPVDHYETLQVQLALAGGVPQAVQEERDSYSIRAVLSEAADTLEVAVYVVRKQSWDRWWRDHGSTMASSSALSPLSGESPQQGSASLETSPLCLPDDTWDAGILDDAAPPKRTLHVAAWTGTHMLVWGGLGFNGAHLSSGGRYDPLTDTWTPMSPIGAPEGRFFFDAAWTGTEFLVWGGLGETSYLDSGGRYDPATDTWTPMSTVNAPEARDVHSVVWSGERMIVWGGNGLSSPSLRTGGLYDPETDEWTSMSTVNAPVSAYSFRSVWAGDRMMVVRPNTLGVHQYHPDTDTWSTTSTVGAPYLTTYTAAWTGVELLFWGYSSFYNTNLGSIYNPTADTWDIMFEFGGPAPAISLWSGSEFIIWGTGSENGRYDLLASRWRTISDVNAPALRSNHTLVWTGDRMIVWGGTMSGGVDEDSGGLYDPVTDSWTPVSTRPAGAPLAGLSKSAWTGNEFIVWGGYGGSIYSGIYLDTGGRYDPLTDAWAELPSIGAPEGRSFYTLTWTGQRILVWGGSAGAGGLDTGYLYDPVADAWAPMGNAGAPEARHLHSAVWTGDRLLVWGGAGASGFLDSGGLYDPLLDTWTAMGSTGAPEARGSHSAIWTGGELVVWGGADFDVRFGNGATYHPGSDTWAPISLVDAPEARMSHGTIWTGLEMIVWGGRTEFTRLDTGARYNVQLDSWMPTIQTGAPQSRHSHSTVWTGSEMLVWGGSSGKDSGARYDPATDSWLPTSQVWAPEGRESHPAVWAGNHMIVWGGSGVGHYPKNGSRYFIGGYDEDGDGVLTCAGDCDDLNAATYPGAPESCDGLDNDCDGMVPPDEVDADTDGWPQCADCDDGNPARFPGNTEFCDAQDNDCDGITDLFPTSCGVGACASFGLCEAGVDNCTPGDPVAETCDGLDNDCDGTLPLEEMDLDSDGFSACAGDCDLSDAATFPGAPEINDRKDNQCPGDFGFGIVDEVSGQLVFTDAGSATLCWVSQAGATGYELLRSDLPDLADNCTLLVTSGTCSQAPESVALGEIHYFAVRSSEPHLGSWGFDSSGKERTGLCGTESCDDGIDNDSDGLLDCEDLADCFGRPECPTATFSFQDQNGDDIAPAALEDFFASLTLTATDFIHFRLASDFPLPTDWCAERADAFKDAYLALTGTGGTMTSAGWSVWSKTGNDPWSGPQADSFVNYYGDSCFGTYSWCSEVGLEGRALTVAPGDVALCEARDALGICGGPTWILTIDLGVDRVSACGF